MTKRIKVSKLLETLSANINYNQDESVINIINGYANLGYVV